MEIGAIPGIRTFRSVKEPDASLELPAIFEIDAIAKARSGREQKQNRKATGVEEEEFGESPMNEQSGTEVSSDSEGSAKSVDFFA